MKFEIIKKEKTLVKISYKASDLYSMPIKSDKILFVTDRTCFKKFKDIMEKAGAEFSKKYFILILSEKEKNLKSLEKILLFLLKNNFSRTDLVIAFGGGSVCDIAALAASLYMRGINLCMIPTTFLSQIDAAFGGKNGADLGKYKNMIGVFRQPDYLFCGVSFYGEQEIKDGYGELLKYFILKPSNFPKNKVSFALSLKKDLKARIKCVKECLKIKSQFVKADPSDLKGIREYLNLGHTAAHAFESASFKKISHGEAVLLGLKYEYLLSKEIFKKNPPQGAVIENFLTLLSPIKINSRLNFRDFIKAVKKDKKNKGKKNTFFLFSPKGEILKINGINERILDKIFRRICDEHIGYKRPQS
ncbi:MAG: 3-dehydroquinate synthase family protein [Elusimicrobiota bacterium]